jgi:hypothetical protein
MDIVPTILVHGWGALFNYEYNGLTPYEIRIKYSRYYYDEAAREAYINNGVSKVCEILSKYQDVIPIVNLTVENGTLTNDVENGMIYAEDGVTWKDFATLVNALGENEKKLLEIVLSQIECYLPKYSIANDNMDSLAIVNTGEDAEEEHLIEEIIEIIALCDEHKKEKTFERIFMVEGYQVLLKRKEEIRRRVFGDD